MAAEWKSGDRRTRVADGVRRRIAGRRADGPAQDAPRCAAGGVAHRRRPRHDRRVLQRLRRAVLLRVVRRAERGHRASSRPRSASAWRRRASSSSTGATAAGRRCSPRSPSQTVADLKKAKLYTSAGNDRMVQWFKANGFEPRAMAMTDIMTGLTTGMVEAVPTTPLAALLFQWYRQTPNMLDIGLAPVVGATVITRKAWNAIPEADRPKLRAAAAGVQKRLQEDVPKQDAAAVAEMTKTRSRRDAGVRRRSGGARSTRSRRRCAARWSRPTSSTSPSRRGTTTANSIGPARRSDPAPRDGRGRGRLPGARRDGGVAAARNRRAPAVRRAASPVPARSFSTSPCGSASWARRLPRARESCWRSRPAQRYPRVRAGQRPIFARGGRGLHGDDPRVRRRSARRHGTRNGHDHRAPTSRPGSGSSSCRSGSRSSRSAWPGAPTRRGGEGLSAAPAS